MNHFNALHFDEPTVTPIERNSQPTAVHFKSWTFPTKISSVVLTILGILKHNYIDNGGAEFTLQIINRNIPMTIFQICMPLRSSQLMVM